MIISEDQSLPKNPYSGKATQGIIKKDGTVNALVAAEEAYAEAQNDMITPRDGYVFKKIKIEA